MKYKVALLVGRFQPFHLGHLYLIKKALLNAEKLAIGIGSSNITDVNNPLDYEIRKKIIKAVLYKEKLENRVIKIVPLNDFYNAEKWKKNVEFQVGKFDVVIGNNEWTNGILRKAGYKILHCPYYKRYLYEGWRIRKLISEGRSFKDRVPSYLIPFLKSNIKYQISNKKSKSQNPKKYPNYQLLTTNYNHVVLGGTFDHFHIGHIALIKKALEIGKKVTIGLSKEKLYKDKYLSELIEPYEIRKKNLERYSENIIPISDIYGNTLKEKEIDAIVVSRETLPNALKINEKRSAFVKTSADKEKLKQLQIVVVENVLADDGKIISSESIRAGEIDREGNSYWLMVNGYWLKKKKKKGKKELILPEKLRESLREPIGEVYKVIKSIKSIKSLKSIKPTMIITVGDIITENLNKIGIEPDIAIIDFKSRRKPLLKSKVKSQKSNIKNVIPAKAGIHLVDYRLRRNDILNNPGTINFQALNIIKKTIDKVLQNHIKQTIVIDGEEDLLTLPAILLAPLGSIVCYGQWDQGAVIVEVTEEKKKEISKILSKFSRRN